MSSSLPDPIDRLLQSEATLPVSPPGEELHEDNRRWLRDSGYSLESVVLIQRLQHAHAARWASVAGAVTDPHARAVLAAVTYGGGSATYADIEEYATVSKRTLRSRIARLEDDGLLERHGKPAVVSFTDEPAHILVQDALAKVLR